MIRLSQKERGIEEDMQEIEKGLRRLQANIGMGKRTETDVMRQKIEDFRMKWNVLLPPPR